MSRLPSIKTNKFFKHKFTFAASLIKKTISFLFLCHLGQSQTNISGNLSGTLTLANSPYLVQGHLMIQPNNKLVIEPGVVIEFQNFFKLNVQGSLLAKGQSNDSIIFRMNPSLSSTGWWGIRFEMTATSQDSSIFEYCKISGGRATGNGDDLNGGGMFIKFFNKVRVSRCSIFDNKASNGAGIQLFYSSAIIDNNNISGNTTHGAWAQISGGGIHCDSLSNARITNNIISNNKVHFGGWGGGIGCTSSSPYIFNNSIHSNDATPEGGGISVIGVCSPTIIGNQINNNTAGQGGGIKIKEQSSPLIKGNTLIANSVYTSSSAWGAHGGGFHIETSPGSEPKIVENVISQNDGDSEGGAIYYWSNSDFNATLTVAGNTIHANTATSGGGLCMYMLYGNLLAQDNVFSNNRAENGGAVYAFNSQTSAAYTNNLFINNTANGNGGALFSEGYSPMITNCTFANNLANTSPSYTTYLYGGGAIFCTSASNPTLTNCILWGNRAISQNGNQIYLEDNASDPNITYTDIEGGSNAMYTNGSIYSGTFINNTNSDPVFVTPSAGVGDTFTTTPSGWSLQAGSPSINSGDPDSTGYNLPLTDIAGQLRIKGIIDQGAFETPGCSGFVVTPTLIASGSNLSVTTPGSSYQWVNCDLSLSAIPGATNSIYTPTVNGNYALTMTQFGCTGTSSCIAMTTVFLDEHVKHSFEYYPNPAKDKVFIQLGEQHKLTVSIYDLSGKLLIKEALGNDGKLDVSDLPRSIYLITIESETNRVNYKLILE